MASDWRFSGDLTDLLYQHIDRPVGDAEEFFGCSMAKRRAILECGQRDFDTPYGDLSPAKLALMYAHTNMKRHVRECIDVFRLAESAELHRSLQLVDLGCGPGTGGLALWDFRGGVRPPSRYYGVDRYRSMLSLAQELLGACGYRPDLRRTLDWRQLKKDQPAVFLLSYLLASESVDAARLGREIRQFREHSSEGVQVVYLNALGDYANRNWATFCRGLGLDAQELRKLAVHYYGAEHGETIYSLFNL